jgi:hypothetical protein
MMKPERFAITTYCSIHNIDHSFISSLQSEGIIDIELSDEGEYIDEDQLHDLELYTRWYQLGINPEGIDALRHIVQKLRNVQSELNLLREKVRFYEQG